MNRNVESHFAQLPHANISRSRFDRSCSIKTTFNAGQIIPFYIDEVLPGDTFDVRTSRVVRMQTLITPMMDNIYLDTYYFYVPCRLCWEHWRELNGENTESAWAPTVEYSVPQITAPAGGWNIGTIADYMGLPTGVSGLSVSALPFRAYALICNEWFRDENLSDPLNIPLGDATQAGSNGSTFVSDVANGGIPYTAAKYHDYFTSCLPAPQKGPDVTIPLGSFDSLPVVGNGNSLAISSFPNNFYASYLMSSGTTGELHVRSMGSSYASVGDVPSGSASTANVAPGTTGLLNVGVATADQLSGNYRLSGLEVPGGAFSAVAASINQLRMAFQIQKLYERDARGGTRYIEILRSHFGVTSPDARLQRPEYLGGNRVPITINQVIQNSETANTPLGETGAMSVTTDVHKDFRKSFVEHGFILGLCVARYDHSYQQGIERFWSRKDRFDYYWPVFANIGEQAVLNKEIYAQGSDEDDEVFGYQEAWADYRYKPSRVTGEMRSSAPQSLDVWHLADDYDTLPSLSDSWIRETPENINRVLAVSSSVSNQFFADIYVQNRTTRPMPLYSIPGLIDHH